MAKEILTSDKKRLKLFEDKIAINKDLIKWRRAEDRLVLKKAEDNENSDSSGSTFIVRGELNSSITNNMSTFNLASNNSYLTTPGDDDPMPEHVGIVDHTYDGIKSDEDSKINSSTSWLHLYQTPEGLSFDEIASAGIKDLTRLLVEKKVKYVMGGYGSFGSTVSSGNNIMWVDSSSPKSNKSNDKNDDSFLGWLKKKMFKKEKSEEEKYEFDALKFFSLIKATSKDSAFTYKDRVSKYLTALHNSVLTGQVALQEELLRGLITNKYESLLYAEGYYYMITEKQVVDFVTKCEKGIAIDYIKNFARPIPQDVIDKIQTVNQLEVFDNYVVMHYDPEGKSYKETAKEEAKRKDPILFGVIAGSNKLYYITDWVDETCDLTLDKFVDTLGIEKEVLDMDYEAKQKKANENKK